MRNPEPGRVPRPGRGRVLSNESPDLATYEVEVNGIRTRLRLNQADAQRIGADKPVDTPAPDKAEQTPPDTPDTQPSRRRKSVTDVDNKARTGDDVENK